MAQEKLAFSSHPGHGDGAKIAAQAQREIGTHQPTGIATDKVNDPATTSFNKRPANQSANKG